MELMKKVYEMADHEYCFINAIRNPKPTNIITLIS